MNLTLCTCTLHSLVSNSNLNRPTIVVQKWMKLEHSRLKSIDKLPLSSLAYMFSRGCRPNLLAIIAVQKAQSIHRSVTEARTNLCTQCPCNRKSMLRFYLCRRDWLNKSIQAEECGHAHRCTRKLPSSLLWQQAWTCHSYYCVRDDLIIFYLPG